MGRRPARRWVTTDIEAVDDDDCTVLHVDMDAFFAAVELRRRPELRGRPMMVAGTAGRGVVLSATYEAREYGVRSAMPTAQALARCPGILVVPPDHDAYRRASSALMDLLGAITPIYEPVSVDEAFLDVNGVRRIAGRPGHIAETIRRLVRDQLGLTATVGVAATKFVAKLASSWAKPDGLLVVPSGDVVGALRPLPVDALWGVGPVTARRLVSCGFVTVGDVADADPARLGRIIGAAAARSAHALACGRDGRKVTPETTDVSLGAERTFERDVTDPRAIRSALLELAGKAARRARRAGALGSTVVLKVRFDDFTTITRSESLVHGADRDADVYAAALRSWHRVPDGFRPVRLLGIRLEKLTRAGHVAEQLELGDDPEKPGWGAAQAAVDELADRFGDVAPRPATLLRAKRSRP